MRILLSVKRKSTLSMFTALTLKSLISTAVKLDRFNNKQKRFDSTVSYTCKSLDTSCLGLSTVVQLGVVDIKAHLNKFVAVYIVEV